jgi:cytochrome c553
LNLHIQLGDHDAGGPFGKNLMQHLIEQEIQEIEAHTAAQVMDMESDDNAL